MSEGGICQLNPQGEEKEKKGGESSDGANYGKVALLKSFS